VRNMEHQEHLVRQVLEEPSWLGRVEV